MLNPEIYSLFKNGSTTYFYSSLFFPKDIKDDVFVLYSFVRKADNFVDAIPQQQEAFVSFRKTYDNVKKGNISDDIVINTFVALMKKRKFEEIWVEAFLDSMQADLTKKQYKNLHETEKYIYGSAEVIGLMMARIMDLPPESYQAARSLGKAMQYINFIRDIQEDLRLGRTYLPANDIKKFGLANLSYQETNKKTKAFQQFISQQITYYYTWQKAAEKGFVYIPKRYLLPIKTASDMYNWTAKTIMNNPFIIYKKKVKPNKFRVFSQVLSNFIRL